MLSARTLKTLAILLAVYVLLALPAYLGPAVLEEVSSYLVMPPLLSIYLFHAWGWVFLALFWLGVAWVLAWGIARLTEPLTPSR